MPWSRCSCTDVWLHLWWSSKVSVLFERVSNRYIRYRTCTYIYTDPRYGGNPKLNILLHKRHFMAMANVQACLGKRFLCEHCNNHSDSRSKHFCKYSCSQCLMSPKYTPDTADNIPLIPLIYPYCNRTFFGVECFENHLNKRKINQQKHSRLWT